MAERTVTLAEEWLELIAENLAANGGRFDAESVEQKAVDTFCQQNVAEELTSGLMMLRVFKDNSYAEFEETEDGQQAKCTGIGKDLLYSKLRLEYALFGCRGRRNPNININAQ